MSATCERPDGRALEISFGVSQLTEEVDADELVGVADVDLMSRKSAKRA